VTKFVITMLAAAITLLQPALSVASVKPTDSGVKPSSFVPHPHTKNHVYGAPIQPAVVGHAKTAHHKHAPKKRSSPGRVTASSLDGGAGILEDVTAVIEIPGRASYEGILCLLPPGCPVCPANPVS
jgi:hypothetical protein